MPFRYNYVPLDAHRDVCHSMHTFWLRKYEQHFSVVGIGILKKKDID